MSADAYEACPKCLKPTTEEIADPASIEHSRRTLREDSWLGMRHGVFCVDYHGVCSECEFNYRFVLKISVG